MKKILLICIVAVVFAFVLVGCGRDDMQESPDRNTATPDRTATRMPTVTPGTTQNPTQDATQNPTQTVENIEPTDPTVKDNIEGAIESIVPDMESIVPDMESMLPHPTATADARNTSASLYTDDEIRSNIRQMAWKQGYTVYDIRNEHRAMTENVQTVDLEKTLENMREWDDMSSTRFVLKGNRVNSVEGLEKVAEFQTPLLSRTEQAMNNIQIANNTLNGLCLLPGEEFSFVFFLGEVSERTGYEEATMFIRTEDGEVKTEKGIGGGICQVASTLHAACLELGETIVERHPHSKTVSYIEQGKDAAISIGYKDFKFVNTKDYTVVLCFFIADKTEIVEIYKV